MTSVHNSVLEDVIAPAQIVGRNTRYTSDGGKTIKISLDPLDRDRVEEKLDAFTAAYKKLTHKSVQFDFAKPTKYQKSVIEFRKKRGE